MTQGPLSAVIAKKLADLARLDRQRELMAAELRGLEEAAKVLGSQVVSPPPAELKPATPTATNPPAKPVRSDTNGAKPSGISAEWKPVLASLSAVGDTFNYTDMLRIAESLGRPLAPGSARAKAMGWRQAGLVKTVRPGVFRITDKGKTIADATMQELLS